MHYRIAFRKSLILFSNFLVSLVLLLLLNENARAQKATKRARNEVKSTLKDGPIDQLLKRIDAAHLMLNQFDDKANSEFNTDKLEKNIPKMEEGMNLVAILLAKKNQKIDINNLQMYAVLLNDIEDQIQSGRAKLLADNKQLVAMNIDLNAFIITKDSVMNKMNIDSNYRGLIIHEISGLSDKYDENEEAIDGSIKRVNLLQAKLSEMYYRITELEDGVYDLNKNYWQSATHKEAPFIWENWSKRDELKFPELSASSHDLPLNSIGGNFKAQKSILLNYFEHNQTGYALLTVLGILFFIWVFLNYRKAIIDQKNVSKTTLNIHYLESIPMVSTLILVLNITPFLDLDTPSLYFEILQTGLILLLTYLFIKHWPRRMFYLWIGLLCLYILFSLLGQDTTLSYWGIIAVMALNIISIGLGIFFFITVKKEPIISGFEKFMILFFIGCNLVAIILNLNGLISLAEQISYAAIFGLTQVISLTTGFQILSEGLFLQAFISRNGDHQEFVPEKDKINKNLATVFSILIFLFWLISFTDNLNVFIPIYDGVISFLGVSRRIGDVTFAYGNVILFFLIISIANFIQKFLGYFLGASNTSDNVELKKKGSRLAITRLLLLTGGFLIAVLASGLPVDRITILLGALGVGIGLGLQSIVNNLVSGIVLIFERPFRIGDLIEVGSRKGKVKEIGLRSSKILTSEGSEVIVPNGDLLSERVVNWTLTNEYARLEFSFKIKIESNLTLAEKLIHDRFDKNPRVLTNLPPEILVDEITASFTSIKIWIWIVNINEEKYFRSDFLSKIYSSFRENNILLED